MTESAGTFGICNKGIALAIWYDKKVNGSYKRAEAPSRQPAVSMAVLMRVLACKRAACSSGRRIAVRICSTNWFSKPVGLCFCNTSLYRWKERLLL